MNQLETNGCEPLNEKYQLSDGTMVFCSFLDTGGSIRFRISNESFYKKVDGFIVVFDITRRNTFEDIRDYFLPKIRENSNDEIPILIIGNKKDLRDSREVSIYEGYKLAGEYNNCLYKEASCIENYNLYEIFEDIIEDVRSYIENNPNYINHRDTISLEMRNHRDNNLNIGNNRRRPRCRNCCN
jgi:small GTP-binding protein